MYIMVFESSLKVSPGEQLPSCADETGQNTSQSFVVVRLTYDPEDVYIHALKSSASEPGVRAHPKGQQLLPPVYSTWQPLVYCQECHQRPPLLHLRLYC